MTSEIRIHFLGTGTSVGVPQIGCKCRVCLSDNPKNKRLRSSLLIRQAKTSVLVDATPDLRQQALRQDFTELDAVVFTHGHVDHVAGFDDLRAFCWKREDRLPLYASPDTMQTLTTMFGWAFSPDNTYRGYVRPEARVIKGDFNIGGLRFSPVPVEHGNVETYGYRIEAGNFRIGYACDVKTLSEEAAARWQNLDVLVIDALRYEPHPTHMTVNEALAVISRLAPRWAYLTHMSHALEYEELLAGLPDHVFPAYDGL